MAIINLLKRMKYNETLSYGHLVNTAIIFCLDETGAHTS